MMILRPVQAASSLIAFQATSWVSNADSAVIASVRYPTHATKRLAHRGSKATIDLLEVVVP
jgi:hypothetical protein